MAASNGRGVLTVGGTVPQQNPTKVKAVLAAIPVGTVSFSSAQTDHQSEFRELLSL